MDLGGHLHDVHVPLIQIPQGNHPIPESVVGVLGHDADVRGPVAVLDALVDPALQVLDGVSSGALSVPQHGGGALVGQAEVDVVVLDVGAGDMDHAVKQGLGAHDLLAPGDLSVEVVEHLSHQLQAAVGGGHPGAHQNLAGQTLHHVLDGHQGSVHDVGPVADLLGDGRLVADAHVRSHTPHPLEDVEGHLDSGLQLVAGEESVLEKTGGLGQLADNGRHSYGVKNVDRHRCLPP